MKRGFKSECESIATAVRAEMGLAAHAPYHYRVKSKDAAGNLQVSADSTFTTGNTAPVVGSFTNNAQDRDTTQNGIQVDTTDTVT